MVFTLSAVLTPVYISRAGFLSGFYYISPCLGLSQHHLSALPDFWYRFISLPSALLCAPFYGCEIFAGQSLSHKAQDREQHPVFTTCKSTPPFPILSGFVDLLCPVCLSLAPCAGWCFSDLELGRLRNVILVLAAHCGALAGLPTQMQIDWKCSLSEEPSALQKQTNLFFFSPFLPTAPHFHVKIRQEYHFRNIFHAL